MEQTKVAAQPAAPADAACGGAAERQVVSRASPPLKKLLNGVEMHSEMAMRPKILIFLIANLLLLFICAVGCSSREVRDDEKEYLVTVRDLQVYGIELIEPIKGETFLAKRNLDGSIEIEYEYDAKKDPNSQENVWLKSEAEILGTPELARVAFEDRIKAYRVGVFLGSGEVEMVEDPDLFASGDENYSAYLEKNGRKLGNVVVVRKGNIVFSLLVVGLYFDDPQLLHALLAPKLAKAGE